MVSWTADCKHLNTSANQLWSKIRVLGNADQWSDAVGASHSSNFDCAEGIRATTASTATNEREPTARRQRSWRHCFPCIAFALKPAGCFKGDECRHCHLCNAEQAKARRRQLQQAARRQKRRLGKCPSFKMSRLLAEDAAI